MKSLYQLFCDHCHWKKITEGTDVSDLALMKNSVIQRGIPYVDPATREIVAPKNIKLKRQYKCPRCGFLVSPRKISDPQEDVDNKIEIERRIKKRLENDEKERIKQIERQHKKQNRANGSETSPK